jgi:hypothetical protein
VIFIKQYLSSDIDIAFHCQGPPFARVKTLLQKSELKHSFEFSIEGKACALRASYIVEEIKAQSRRD